VSAPTIPSIFGTPNDAPVIVDGPAFDALPEYSTTLPTCTRDGKQWRRRVPAFGEPHGWWIGEYGPEDDGSVPIAWRRLLTRRDADVYLDGLGDGITLGEGDVARDVWS